MKKYIDTINELRAMNVRDIFEKVSNYHYLSNNSVEYSDDAYFIFNIIDCILSFKLIKNRNSRN